MNYKIFSLNRKKIISNTVKIRIVKIQTIFIWEEKVMAAVMLQAIPSFFAGHSENSLFISSDNYDNFLVTRDYCVAAHDSTFCSLKHCQYHILLIADKDMNDLFTKVDRFCFNFQRVDCFYTLFKHRFSGNVVLKSGEIFDTVERAVSFNKLNKGVDKMPSIAKKRLLRKKFKKHMLTSIQKSISVQTSGSVFVERVERVRRTTKFELELMKIIDCFLDGYGRYESHLVTFKIKPCK